MRYDIEKHYFLTKKFIELKNPSLVQRAFRSKFKKQREAREETKN